VVVLNVVTYDVVIEVDNSSLELKPGMTATVSVTTARRDGVPRVPVRALRFNPEAGTTPGPRARGAGSAVWRVKPGGGIERIEAQLGLRDDVHAEVVGGGLEPGDEVILSARKTADGTRAAPSLPGFPARRR
jgi:HlyD family secretion protein